MASPVYQDKSQRPFYGMQDPPFSSLLACLPTCETTSSPTWNTPPQDTHTAHSITSFTSQLSLPSLTFTLLPPLLYSSLHDGCLTSYIFYLSI